MIVILCFSCHGWAGLCRSLGAYLSVSWWNPWSCVLLPLERWRQTGKPGREQTDRSEMHRVRSAVLSGETHHHVLPSRVVAEPLRHVVTQTLSQVIHELCALQKNVTFNPADTNQSQPAQHLQEWCSCCRIAPWSPLVEDILLPTSRRKVGGASPHRWFLSFSNCSHHHSD